MKCKMKLKPGTDNICGATLYTTGIETMVIVEALKMYANERDNPDDRRIAEHMIRSFAHCEIEDEPKTERSAT